MSTKKTTAKTEKQYLVLDPDGDILAYGLMDGIIDALNQYNDGDDEDDELSFDKWVAQCTIYELGNGRKMKYTPAKFEIK